MKMSDCCVIEKILSRPFASRSLDEQKEIVANGRPTPDLDIATKLTNIKDDMSQHFQKSSYKNFYWLTACKTLKKLFCFQCLLFAQEKSFWTTNGYGNFSKFLIAAKIHEHSHLHREACLNFDNFEQLRVSRNETDQQKMARKYMTSHNSQVPDIEVHDVCPKIGESRNIGVSVASKFYNVPELIAVETRLITDKLQVGQKFINILSYMSVAPTLPVVNRIKTEPTVRLLPSTVAVTTLLSNKHGDVLLMPDRPRCFYGRQQGDILQELQSSTRPERAATTTTPPLHPPPLPIAKSIHSKVVEIAAQTKNVTPSRDRASVDIKCDMDFKKFVEVKSRMTDDAKYSNPALKFRKYARRMTHSWNSGGKFECLECGEVKVSFIKMLKHMILHYGPTCLCFKCGTVLSHELLLKDHKCVNSVSIRNKRKICNVDLNLKCPYYSCPVIAVSRHELYDHINEHAGIYAYRCMGCQRSFKTYGESKYHMYMRMNCLVSEKYPLPYGLPKNQLLYRKRVSWLRASNGKSIVVKSGISNVALKHYKRRTFNTPRYCQLCLQRCSNVFKLKNHIKRYTVLYKMRLGWKIDKEHDKMFKTIQF